MERKIILLIVLLYFGLNSKLVSQEISFGLKTEIIKNRYRFGARTDKTITPELGFNFYLKEKNRFSITTSFSALERTISDYHIVRTTGIFGPLAYFEQIGSFERKESLIDFTVTYERNLFNINNLFLGFSAELNYLFNINYFIDIEFSQPYRLINGIRENIREPEENSFFIPEIERRFIFVPFVIQLTYVVPAKNNINFSLFFYSKEISANSWILNSSSTFGFKINYGLKI